MIRVGIIGCGNIAQVHAWSLSRTDGVQIAACADIKTERAEKMSREFTDGRAAVYAGLTDMLSAGGIDAVHICLPHYLHVPAAMEALKAGCAVFMEKPPAVTMAEYEALRALAASVPQPLGFCFQNRYNATTVKLDSILAEGRLGAVKGARGIVTWRRDEGYYSDDWHGTLSRECGGALMNQSIHTLDLMLRYLGAPEKVEARMACHHLPGRIEVEDMMEAWLETADGKRGCFYANTGYAEDAPVILEIACEKGRATLIDQMILLQENGKAPEQILCESPAGIGKSCWGSSHLLCIRDFYACMKENRPFMNNLAGVENTLRTTLRIYESARK